MSIASNPLVTMGILAIALALPLVAYRNPDSPVRRTVHAAIATVAEMPAVSAVHRLLGSAPTWAEAGVALLGLAIALLARHRAPEPVAHAVVPSQPTVVAPRPAEGVANAQIRIEVNPLIHINASGLDGRADPAGPPRQFVVIHSEVKITYCSLGSSAPESRS